MKFRKSITLSILITLTTISQMFAQSKQIVIQIDTINSFDPIETMLNFKVKVSKQGFLNLGDSFDSTAAYSLSTYPNYLNTIMIDSDTSEIEIPIDLNGSVISILGSYSMDTIRINKLDFFRTQPPDSTFSNIYKYRKINGDLSEEPFKTKRKIKVENVKSPPKIINLIVNNKNYNCELKLKKSSGLLITHGHGYNRRKYLDNNGDYKRRLIYIYVSSETVQYYWKGNVNLKK